MCLFLEDEFKKISCYCICTFKGNAARHVLNQFLESHYNFFVIFAAISRIVTVFTNLVSFSGVVSDHFPRFLPLKVKNLNFLMFTLRLLYLDKCSLSGV
jgi:hypothetical protein